MRFRFTNVCHLCDGQLPSQLGWLRSKTVIHQKRNAFKNDTGTTQSSTNAPEIVCAVRNTITFGRASVSIHPSRARWYSRISSEASSDVSSERLVIGMSCWSDRAKTRRVMRTSYKSTITRQEETKERHNKLLKMSFHVVKVGDN